LNLDHDQNNDSNASLLFFRSCSRQTIHSRLVNYIENDSQDQNTNSFDGQKKNKTIVIEFITERETLNEDIDDMIKYSNFIVVLLVNEEKFFEDCILNRQSKSEFLNKLWPFYVNFLNKIFVSIKSIKLTAENNLYIVDDNIPNCFNFYKDLIRKCAITDRKYLTSMYEAIRRIGIHGRYRDNNLITEIFKEKKKNFFNNFYFMEKSWFDKFNSNQYSKENLIDEIIYQYQNRQNLHEEEKSVFKNVISSNESKKESICSILIREAILICYKINETNHQFEVSELEKSNKDIAVMINNNYDDDENLERLLCIGDIMDNMGRHYIFGHRIFNDANYLNLIVEMLNSKNYLIKMKSTILIHTFLKTDLKRYGSKLIIYDNSIKGVSIVKLVFETIYTLYYSVVENETTETHENSSNNTKTKLNDIIELLNTNLSCMSLELLLKGSYENCSKLSVDDIKNLIKLSKIYSVHPFIDFNLAFRTKFRMFKILNMHLKYGPKEIWRNHIDIIQLLNDVNRTIHDLAVTNEYGPIWFKTTHFYKDLLLFLEKDSQNDEILNCISNLKLDETALVFSDEEKDKQVILWGETEENIAVLDEAKDEHFDLDSKHLHDLYYLNKRLNSKNKNNEKHLFYENSFENNTKLIVENEMLKSENENLKLKLDNQQEDYDILKSKYQILEKDRNARIQDLNELRNQYLNEKKSLSNKTTSQITTVVQSQKNPPTQDFDDEISKLISELDDKKIELNAGIAKKFINCVKSKRENLKDFRKLICGSLNHLSVNLYSSSLHFLFEIIQNFEDNEYNQGSKPWLMKLVIEKDYLLFCSNEVGFQPKDIISICSCSESSKSKGKHIGNKGLGFKSVFLCSDNPIIVSKPYWQFQFLKKKNQDEISYITPYYIESDEMPKELIERLLANQDCNTFIFLPLKDIYKFDEKNNESTTFFHKMIKIFNQNILLFTQKLETIIIEDNINENIIRIERMQNEINAEEKIKEDISMKGNSYLNEIELNDVIIQMKIIDKKDASNILSNKKISTRLCKCKIKMPEDIIEEEGLKNIEDWISIGFPYLQNQDDIECPVFAFLPIYNIGFKFYLNCNWSLVTSRESINEHARINKYYRDQFVDFFVWIAKNDISIQKRLLDYIPKENSDFIKTKDEWKLFVHDIKTRVKPLLKEILLSNIMLKDDYKNDLFKPKITNYKLDELIDDEYLELTKIKLINPNMVNLSQSDLEECDIKQLSIQDIIDSFNINLHDFNLENWLMRRKFNWWENLFRLLRNDSNNLDIKKVKEAKIFRIRKMIDHRNNITKRISINDYSIDKKPLYFIFDDKNFRSWRSHIKIIDYDSIIEKQFLIDVLNIERLTIDTLMEFILLDHTQNNIFYSKEKTKIKVVNVMVQRIVWSDLKFIKENFESYLKFNKNLFVHVPTISNEFIASKFALLPSIFNYDLTKLDLIDKNQYINFINFKQISSNLLLKEILEWEFFFIELGCIVPNINIEMLKYNLSFKNNQLPLFNQLNIFDQFNIQLAIKIDDLISLYNLSDIIKYLPIQSSYKNDQNYITSVSNTCSSKLFNNLLPSVAVPEHSYEFAKRIGIKTELNLKTCIDILKGLVNDGVNDSDLYIEWFLNIKSFLKEKENYCGLLDVPLISLKSTTDNEKNYYYKLNDVFCCENQTPGLLLICEYLNKTIISFNYNSRFKPIETILINLGCLTKLSIEDIIQALKIMSSDSNLFNNNNVLSVLTNKGYECFKEVYFSLEEALKFHFIDPDFSKDDMNLKERKIILNQVKNNFELMSGLSKIVDHIPIITYEHHLLNIHDLINNQNLLVCFQIDIIHELKASPDFCEYTFFDPRVAKFCPYTMGLVNVNYMDDMVDVYLEHITNNIEYTNELLSTELKKITNFNHLEIIRSKYIALSVSLRNKIMEESGKTNKVVIFNNIKFGLFDKKWLVFSNSTNTLEEFSSLLFSAIKFLFKLSNKNLDEDYVVNQSRLVLNNLNQIIFRKSNWKTWENAFKESNKFNLVDILMPDNDYDFSELSDVYFAGISNQSFNQENSKSPITQSTSKRKFVNNNYISDEENYLRRVHELESPELNIKSSIINSEFKFQSFQVNTERNKIIGIKAEHFFCIWLKKHYGESFNEFENWLSSARNRVYPSSSYFNDSLGYDFKIKDYLNLFFKSNNLTKNLNVKTCFIEVKGTETSWDGLFHISKNEIEFKNTLKKDLESYIIVIIENVIDPNKINIAKIIDWTNNNKFIHLEPESYLANYLLLNENDESMENFRNNSEITQRTNHTRSNFSNKSNNNNNNYRGSFNRNKNSNYKSRDK
jgi:hypothetical protein